MKLTTVQVVIICGLAFVTLAIGILLNPTDIGTQNDDQEPASEARALSILNTSIPNSTKVKPKDLVLSEHRFNRKNFAKTDSSTNIQNSLGYLLFSPSKPWPKGLTFPLIIHIRDNNETAFSAEYITQEQMAYNFPAFSVVPDIKNLFREPDEGNKRTTTNLATKNFANKYNDGTQSVNYTHMREDAAQIIKPLSLLISHLKETLPVDGQKIYIIGCGYGGAIVYSMLESKPETFAAAVTINSSWQTEKLSKFTTTPILMQNGKKNTKFSSFIANNLANDINKMGGKAIFQGYESMPHTCSYKNLYSSNVWKWMFSQKNQ